MYPLGLSSFALPWTIQSRPDYTPFDLLDEAKRLGLQGVQVCDNLPLDALSAEQLRALRARADSLGLWMEVGMRGLLLDEVRRHLDICETLQARLLRIVVDRGEFEPNAGEIVGLLKKLVPELEERGITLGIENHDRFKARDLAELIWAADSPNVRICLDTANSLGAGEGLGEVLETLGPLTVNLHVKEFKVRRLHHQLGFVVDGAPTGQGQVDWQAVLDSLPADITLSLEQWPPEQLTLNASAELERIWLTQSVTYLRELLRGRQNAPVTACQPGSAYSRLL